MEDLALVVAFVAGVALVADTQDIRVTAVEDARGCVFWSHTNNPGLWTGDPTVTREGIACP